MSTLLKALPEAERVKLVTEITCALVGGICAGKRYHQQSVADEKESIVKSAVLIAEEILQQTKTL